MPEDCIGDANLLEPSIHRNSGATGLTRGPYKPLLRARVRAKQCAGIIAYLRREFRYEPRNYIAAICKTLPATLAIADASDVSISTAGDAHKFDTRNEFTGVSRGCAHFHRPHRTAHD